MKLKSQCSKCDGEHYAIGLCEFHYRDQYVRPPVVKKRKYRQLLCNEIKEIKTRSAKGESTADLAAAFDVSWNTIHRQVGNVGRRKPKEQKSCSVPNCGGKYYARDLCSKHYRHKYNQYYYYTNNKSKEALNSFLGT